MRYFLFCAFLCILFSCNRLEEKDMAVLMAANESLDASNKIIENSSLDIYNALQANLSDPSKRIHTLQWQPYAEQIKLLTNSLINTIDIIRQKLIIEASGSFGKMQNTESYNKTQPVTKVFFIQKNAEELDKKLTTYKQNLFLINEDLTKEFEKNIIVTTKEYQLNNPTLNNFATTHFKNINTLSAFLLLNKIESNIRKIENDFVRYCHGRTIMTCGMGIEKISSIITQNSTVFKRGESLEITAGIGSFSVASRPKINIANKNIEINEVVGIYKTTVENSLGKHTIPISIEFTKPDGTVMKKNQLISYTVVE